MREELRFTPNDTHVVAFRPSNGKRYSLKPWQYVMICRFDGEKTFEQLGREIYNEFSGLITARGLLNFYTWLYNESLILCNFESVFELVGSNGEATSDHAFSETVKNVISHPMVPKVAISAIAVCFCLAVVRIAFVAAPIFEPPVDRLYAEMDRRLSGEVGAPEVNRQAVAEVTEPVVEMIEPAARVIEVPEAPAFEPAEKKVETEVADIPKVETPAAEKKAPLSEKDILLNRMDELRQKMAGCRIRRDEFYLQNNEEGYRKEVELMTELAREIGEIGAKL